MSEYLDVRCRRNEDFIKGGKFVLDEFMKKTRGSGDYIDVVNFSDATSL